MKLKTAALCFLNTSEPLAVFGNAPIHFFFFFSVLVMVMESKRNIICVLYLLPLVRQLQWFSQDFFFSFPHVDSIQILTQTEMEFSEGKTQNMERFPALHIKHH